MMAQHGKVAWQLCDCQGIQTSIARNPYIFVIFRGVRNRCLPPPSGSAHVVYPILLSPSLWEELRLGLNIFYLYNLWNEKHILRHTIMHIIQMGFKESLKTHANVYPILILSKFEEKTISVPMLILVLKCTARVWKLFNYTRYSKRIHVDRTFHFLTMKQIINVD